MLTLEQTDTLRGYLGEILATDPNKIIEEIYESLPKDKDGNVDPKAVYDSYMAFPVDVVFPNGLAVTGYVDMASWAESHWYDPHQTRVLYNVSFTIVEG
jgi:hypothetical protein